MDYIFIRPDDGCYSTGVGRQGGEQTISLIDDCFVSGTVEHELMHALGFFHEQNRNDRNLYVQVTKMLKLLVEYLRLHSPSLAMQQSVA